MATNEAGLPLEGDQAAEQQVEEVQKALMPTLDDLTEDYKRLQRQKSRKNGGVEGRILMNLAFVDDNHYVDFRDGQLINEAKEPNKIYLTWNLIKGRLNKLIGRLASLDGSFRATPDKKDPQSVADAQVIDKLIVALDAKVDQPSKYWEILWWMAVGGVAFEYTPWVPDAVIEVAPVQAEDGSFLFTNTASGEVVPEPIMTQMVEMGAPKEIFELLEELQPQGEVGSRILGPLNVFLDQSVKSIKDLAPDQRVYVAEIKTIGWVRDTFGVEVEPMKDMSIVTSRISSAGDGYGRFLKDIIPIVQGSASDADPKMTIVVEAFSPKSKDNPEGTYSCFIPGQVILHQDKNPYGEIPLTDYHWSPVTTTFWTQDYVSGLIPPQRFINKRISQLAEQSNATIYDLVLTAPDIKASDIPADFPGVLEGGIDPDTGMPKVARLGGPQLPAWFMQSIEMSMGVFNDVAGGADLFQENKFPGQLRGPMAVPMLQEILDTQWGPLYRHIGERLAETKQQRLNRVRDFYPPSRTMHYVSRDQKDEVMTFHSDKMLRGTTNYTIRVERASLIPELRALTEARITERLAGPLAVLYMDQRTGKLDTSKIAADLRFGDTGREDRESQYRKLANELIDMLWKGQQIPPPLPFYDHRVMLDELEATMATTEFLRSSLPIQQAFLQRWEAHRFFLQQEAMAQQQMMMSGAIQSAVAQATQQAAAQAAATTVNSTQEQMGAQRAQPTEEYVRSAHERAAQESGNKPKPKPKSRKVTYEERE